MKTKSIKIRAYRHAAWICSNTNQRAVLARDDTGSMHGEKAIALSACTLELLRILAEPVNKDGFWLGVIDYNETARLVQPLEKASKIQDIPPVNANGYTNTSAGLELALKVLVEADKYADPEGPGFLRPTVILLGDGINNRGPDPSKIANELKNIATLVTVAFGTDADELLLKKLASTPDHFRRVTNGAELRKYFAEVGDTLSASLASGVEASRQLAELNSFRIDDLHTK